MPQDRRSPSGEDQGSPSRYPASWEFLTPLRRRSIPATSNTAAYGLTAMTVVPASVSWDGRSVTVRRSPEYRCRHSQEAATGRRSGYRNRRNPATDLWRIVDTKETVVTPVQCHEAIADLLVAASQASPTIAIEMYENRVQSVTVPKAIADLGQILVVDWDDPDSILDGTEITSESGEARVAAVQPPPIRCPTGKADVDRAVEAYNGGMQVERDGAMSEVTDHDVPPAATLDHTVNVQVAGLTERKD